MVRHGQRKFGTGACSHRTFYFFLADGPLEYTTHRCSAAAGQRHSGRPQRRNLRLPKILLVAIYSWRRAVMGLTRAARSAGIKAAIRATIPNKQIAATIVSGSSVLSP